MFSILFYEETINTYWMLVKDASVALENRPAALQKHLVNRGYKETFVLDHIRRARMLDRNELFAPRQGTTRKRVPFVVTYLYLI